MVMTTTMFSTLPAEIHIVIAKQLDQKDLLNLCRVSKWAYERCLHVLYHHVNLMRDQRGSDLSDPDTKFSRLWERDAYNRQQQLVRTLLSHPEYGRYIRSLKGMLSNSEIGCISDEYLWRAMQSLTHVQRVYIGSCADSAYLYTAPSSYIPSCLFESATSVTLVGQMQFHLAYSILKAINPAALQHLCLDMVRDRNSSLYEWGSMPGDRGEDGRVIARGATSGLLTRLTGRCTALQTLILRRIGQGTPSTYHWHAAAEEASYTEWADFIRSVQGTVEKIEFEQAEIVRNDTIFATKGLPFRVMDERFERFIFPTIVSGNWPCLTVMELRGVRGSKEQGGTAGLAMNLRLVHSITTWIEVKELAHHIVRFPRK